MTPARHSDHITSHIAAAQAFDFVKQHHCKILCCLYCHGPLGKDGIAAKTGLNGVAVARRMKELEREGLAKPTGDTVPSNSGRPERLWKAT